MQRLNFVSAAVGLWQVEISVAEICYMDMRNSYELDM